MSSIGGFYGFDGSHEEKETLLDSINRVQKKRGPAGAGFFLSGSTGVAAGGTRPGKNVPGRMLLAPEREARRKPFTWRTGDRLYAVALDGEFYNRPELKDLLAARGEQDVPCLCDEELALKLYLCLGPDFVKRINGVFSMAIADTENRRLILYRDRIGAKPLFYARRGDTVFFASLIKGLLACPGVEAEIDGQGLNEIFSIGPARTPGNGVFRGISELEPAHFMVCSPAGIRTETYWALESRPHEDSYAKTVETVTELVLDAITRQAQAETPVCALLSGGLDSSLVSSVCAGLLKKQGKQLTTFSFDFKDNDKYFKANDFQPSMDRPYVDAMVKYLDSDHHYLECDSETQVRLLSDSVLAADLPVMADIDSSLLHFCSQVADYNSVALTGECADEIFCGYPWYHRQELLEADTFPWTKDLEARKVLLKDEFSDSLSMDAYVQKRCRESLSQMPVCPEDDAVTARRREIAWLNLKWFMVTLLNRMDRTSSVSGLTARVPFADHRIIEYMWNIPWEMKARDGVVKHLLRESGKGLLPREILCRRKSPYPKTYVPHYEKLLAGRVREILDDSSSPANAFLDREKTLRFLESPSDYGRPWYGQLMAAPQMMAYVIQVDFWLKNYKVRIV